ncbi:hypothetical protein HELRODRAFT_184022 [Helobdella robusta]|uniref:Uncharacterized protein n=1 Tax=Helobdella robusta TaxID=6412 RepID=T1FKG0_HELRO|nr:hypothetical protein HELRODRAFT_184022 [Helobdella robusta]ESO09190.1 hypothetical protein HELRODRAFT_184022 [Helobdella robusta]
MATICIHCNKSFVSIGRHSWRCTKLNTISNVNISTVITASVSPNLNVNNSSNNINSNFSNFNSNNVDNLLSCCCGKYCKGRRGLIMHQRSCKMFKTLRVTNKKSNHENDCSSSPSSPRLPTSASASETDPSSTSTESTDVDTSESLLPGVKLPRTEAEWTEANDYFESIEAIFQISAT